MAVCGIKRNEREIAYIYIYIYRCVRCGRIYRKKLEREAVCVYVYICEEKYQQQVDLFGARYVQTRWFSQLMETDVF